MEDLARELGNPPAHPVFGYINVMDKPARSLIFIALATLSYLNPAFIGLATLFLGSYALHEMNDYTQNIKDCAHKAKMSLNK